MSEEAASTSAGLVVIGASAGGIDALGELLGPIDASFAAPIVVAQHTQPSRASHLAEILASRTRLGVVLVQQREQLRPGTVYVVPSDHHVLVTDHVVEARTASGDRPSPSIDRLLATAAGVYGERLIAVILSGMGSDGVVGAGEVKARGGTVVIQNPETAAQPSMPRALPPTLVDFVANADRMGELLVELVNTPTAPQAEDDERLLAQFLDRVRERTGIDFSAYKRPTIMRRLRRRMVATANPQLKDYVRYVQKHPEEFGRLSSAFLIKVTQFFRDADLFEYLGSTVVPTLIEEARGQGRELRIWSAGCATGEEAFSLAIMLADTLGDELGSFTIRIFATDLDEDAIAFARRGMYPASAMSAVRPDLLDRYFIDHGDHYEVVKEIRSMVVFGQHDLGQRAPFPRIDLALCRNVLIYFTSELQKRALQLFAFSLREGGYLVLGKAESSTPYAEHFILDQPRLKVYRRAGERVLIPPARIRVTSPVATIRGSGQREPAWAGGAGDAIPSRDIGRPGPARADDLLLRLPVGVVVIDPNYDISFVNATARRLLGIHGTALGADFVHLAHRLPSDELREAVAAATAGEPDVITRALPIQSDEGGDTTHVQLILQPRRQDGRDGVASVVITVVDVSDSVRDRRGLETDAVRSREDRGVLEERVERVTRSNRDLLLANEEMTNANAMLRTTNEELIVANEEVQAATEEVETLNEELQATNEELETLNEELQATVEELNTTNDDLEARSAELTEAATLLAEQRQRSEQERERLTLILDGMSEAVLVVGNDRTTVTSNRAYDGEFGSEPLVPEDGAGNPLPEAEWPQVRAANDETFSMSFTHTDRATGGRRWYEATGRVAAGQWGNVVVIRDITDRSLRHLQERFIDTASHEFQTPLAALRNYLALVDRGAGDTLDEKTRKYLDGALEQSRLLVELASRLFDVSVIRHGRSVVRLEPVDLRAVVEESVGQARMAAPDRPIELHLPRAKAVVDGDPMRLRQLIGNLLANANTHGASNAPVQVTLERRGRDVAVSIRDAGPGIPPEVLAAMFTPFTPSGSEDRTGLGLGLFLAQTYAVEHGGTLQLDARDGGGTEARLTLPLSGTVAPR